LLQVLLGSLVLSLIHASIPNHWLPLVAVSKAQRWNHGEALLITGITGAAHASSTVLIGIGVGLLGYRLADDSVITGLVPAVVLVGLGIAYLVLDRRGHHVHAHHTGNVDIAGKAPTFSLVASLSAAMFFSPCVEIEAYYLQGGALGWPGILAISALYLTVTVLGMVVVVHLALRGAERVRSRYLEQHEKQVTGLVLIALGIATFAAGW